MSKSVTDAFNRVLTDLTRSVDQLERAVAGDISIHIGGAAVDHRINDAILDNTGLKDSVIAGLSGAGYASATVLLAMLLPLADEADEQSAKAAAEQLSELATRLKAASAQYPSKKVRDKIDASDIHIPTGRVVHNENDVIEVLSELGLTDVENLEEIEPGVFTGTAIVDGEVLGGILSTPFNTEARDQWGPASEYPRRNDVDPTAGFGTRRFQD